MKIALVLMPAWSTMTAPLGIAAMAATLRQAGHEVKCFDFNVKLWRTFGRNGKDQWSYGLSSTWQHESSFLRDLYPMLEDSVELAMKEVADWNPEAVGFSVFLTGIQCTRKAAEVLKRIKPNVKIVYGGPEINRSRIEFHQEFSRGTLDAAVMGEGELSAIELFRRWEKNEPLNGCLGVAYKDDNKVVIYEGIRQNISLDSLPLPDFTDFDLALYEREAALPVMMSRGCVAKCTFCSETRFWNNFRYRNAKSIYEEMEHGHIFFGCSRFEMADSLINGNFQVLSDLADLIIKSGLQITWGGYARIDRRMNPELLGRLAKSGLDFLNFGLETGSQKIMDLMEKRTTVSAAREVIRNAGRLGISVSVNIIVGFPGETEEDFQATIDFLKESKKYIYVVSTGETLSVNHSTPLMDQPEKFGIQALNGKAKLDEYGDWISVDGTNTIAVRKNRLKRLRDFLDEENMFWWPSGNNRKEAPHPVDIDSVLAKIKMEGSRAGASSESFAYPD